MYFVVSRTILVLLLIGCSSLERYCYAQNYKVIDLGPLPDGSERTSALGLNNHGVVVGQSFVSAVDSLTSGERAVQWDNGGDPLQLWEANTACFCDPPGTPTVPFAGGQPFAINDNGFIVGRHWNLSNPLPSPGVPHGTAFVIQGSDRTTYQGLGTLGGENSIAFDINNDGVVVGTSSSPTLPRAFMWTDAEGMVDLGTLPGHLEAEARAINNLGQIVGISLTTETGAGDVKAFLYDPVLGMMDIGISGDANDVNDLGQVIGTSASASSGAYIWDSVSGFQSINQSPELAFRSPKSINNLGQVVGRGNEGNGDVAVIWDEDNGIRKLDSLLVNGAEWELSIAFDINEFGEITGKGQLNGTPRGFMLVPVPEPNAISLMTIGGILFLIFKNWKKQHINYSQ